MANGNAKGIREEIKALKEKAGVTDKMARQDKELLNGLRERLKLVRELNKKQKDLLDKSFKQTDQEETSLRLKKSKFKWAKDISKTLDEQLNYERDTQEIFCNKDEFKEGVRAFLEKRKPNFKDI